MLVDLLVNVAVDHDENGQWVCLWFSVRPHKWRIACGILLTIIIRLLRNLPDEFRPVGTFLWLSSRPLKTWRYNTSWNPCECERSSTLPSDWYWTLQLTDSCTLLSLCSEQWIWWLVTRAWKQSSDLLTWPLNYKISFESTVITIT